MASIGRTSNPVVDGTNRGGDGISDGCGDDSEVSRVGGGNGGVGAAAYSAMCASMDAAIGGSSLIDILALRGLGDGGIGADSSVSNTSRSSSSLIASSWGIHRHITHQQDNDRLPPRDLFLDPLRIKSEQRVQLVYSGAAQALRSRNSLGGRAVASTDVVWRMVVLS
ncbi:hypothetical protein Tco_0388875 [Tanacetum coccineum]